MIATVEETSIRNLNHWLNYGKHMWVLGGGVVWLPYRIVIYALTLVALLFTPYLLWMLFKARWYKSISVFGIAVLLPLLISQLIFTDPSSITGYLFISMPILFFYIYLWVLEKVVNEYLIEQNELSEIKYKRAKYGKV